MFRRHAGNQLAALLDRRLGEAESARVAAHLERCERCRRELEQVRLGAQLASSLRLSQAPAGLWREIEAAEPAPVPWRRAWAAAAALLVVGIAVSALWMRLGRTGYQVVRIDGAPVVGEALVRNAARLAEGEWVETDANSRARIQVGGIGQVAVEPNTRIRLVAARRDQHRLALARGRMRAEIWAPPRLFFLETPSALAVDLGCVYTMQVDKNGDGLLRVISGWVSLESGGRESMVPGGAACRTRPGAGPGTPYFEDATARLRDALAGFDLGGDERSLEVVLAESRPRDTLTLWHLLGRVERPARERIYTRMAGLTKPPQGVLRDRVLELDRATLDRWRAELEWTW